MKKIVGFLLVCSTLLFSACSNDKKAESTDVSSKQETKVSSTNDSKKEKEAEVKKKAEEAEKKKQEEISKKVLEADTAMKNAEANPTDETISAAKSAIEAIPDGNNELQKRLETATANLAVIKQQAETSSQVQQQAEQAPQTDSLGRPVILKQNDTDGNGIADDSPYNIYSSWDEAQAAVNSDIAKQQAQEQARQTEIDRQRDEISQNKQDPPTLGPDGNYYHHQDNSQFE